MAITTLLATLLGLAAGADAGPVTLSGEQGAKLDAFPAPGEGWGGGLAKPSLSPPLGYQWLLDG